MMKEAKPMLQNLNSNAPTSHKIQLLPYPPLKSDAKMRKTYATVSDDQSQPHNSYINVELHKDVNTSEGGKEEDNPMSSSSFHGGSKAEESGRERLKRHRVEVAGQLWIPDIWEQENFLQDWIDCKAFDSALASNEIMSARASLVEEGRRAHSGRIGVENSC